MGLKLVPFFRPKKMLVNFIQVCVFRADNLDIKMSGKKIQLFLKGLRNETHIIRLDKVGGHYIYRCVIKKPVLAYTKTKSHLM